MPKAPVKKKAEVVAAPAKVAGERKARVPAATSVDGKYKYALARLHKMAVAMSEDEESKVSLRAALKSSGDYESTAESINAHNIDMETLVAKYFDETVANKTAKDE